MRKNLAKRGTNKVLSSSQLMSRGTTRKVVAMVATETVWSLIITRKRVLMHLMGMKQRQIC